MQAVHRTEERSDSLCEQSWPDLSGADWGQRVGRENSRRQGTANSAAFLTSQTAIDHTVQLSALVSFEESGKTALRSAGPPSLQKCPHLERFFTLHISNIPGKGVVGSEFV